MFRRACSRRSQGGIRVGKDKPPAFPVDPTPSPRPSLVVISAVETVETGTPLVLSAGRWEVGFAMDSAGCEILGAERMTGVDGVGV